jgi:hypothetical protein
MLGNCRPHHKKIASLLMLCAIILRKLPSGLGEGTLQRAEKENGSLASDECSIE